MTTRQPHDSRESDAAACEAGAVERLVRRIPVDFRAVAAEAGMTHGKLCYSTWAGWCVQNATRNPAWPDLATITPPPMQPRETRLAVANGHWCFYAPIEPSSATGREKHE